MGFEYTRLNMLRLLRPLIAAIMILILAMFVLALFVLYATAHEAPSGWKYPTDCCAGKDCHPVACEELTERGDGGFDWKNLHFGPFQVRQSGDHSCHVCHQLESIRGGPVTPVTPICVFIVPMT